MKNELTKIDKTFIAFNVVLAILGSLLSIIPTFAIYVICLFGAHGFYAGGYHPEIYLYLLIPAGFYLLWICTIGAGINANIKKETSTAILVLFFFNILLTVFLLGFYLYWVLELKLHF